MELFMVVLIAYMIFFIPTKIIKFNYKFEIIKELAKKGKKLSNYYEFNKSTLKDLIPVANILVALSNIRKLKKNKDIIITSLMESVEVTEMTDDEKNEYLCEDPEVAAIAINTDNVILTNKNYDVNKFVPEHTIKLDKDNLIFYQVNSLAIGSKYKIISTKGEVLASLSEEEQVEIIEEYYEFVSRKTKEYIDEYYEGNEEKFEDDILLNRFDFNSYKSNLTKEYEGMLTNKILKKID